MGFMTEVHKQVITGVVPPQLAEAMIREVWPSVAAHPAVASLGRILTRTIVLAPLAWLMMAPFYFIKVLPGFARRYTLTNQRLLIRRGMSAKLNPKPADQVALADIDEVRILYDANSAFYLAGNMEIVGQGTVLLKLAGVPEPESFRHAIVNAYKAWVPGKASGPFVPASATK
jgi:hypothetical protein